MAKLLVIVSTICLVSIVLLGGAAGAGSDLAPGRPTSPGRPKRELPDHMEADADDSSDHLKAGGSEQKDFGAAAANAMDPSTDLRALTLVKRAPNGFTGMRGKKQFEFTDLSPNSLDWLDSAEDPGADSDSDWDTDTDSESDPAPVPSGAWQLGGGGRRYKKAPSAFYGVRGKKFADGGSSSGSSSNFLNDLVRKLEEDHVREMLLQDIIERLTVPSEYAGEVEKRAPAGFMGMRGKRTLDELPLEAEDKRSPGNAFVGVRGKKEAADHQALKRSPLQQAAFYGTRGKKQPFVDFRNKFVGVRGKKSFAEQPVARPLTRDQGLESMADGPNNGLNAVYGRQPRYLVDILPLFLATSGKRAPSGFLGMRGKRAAPKTDADFDEEAAN